MRTVKKVYITKNLKDKVVYYDFNSFFNFLSSLL